MSKTHIVKQGEHLSGIAMESGFRNSLVIWNHPNNAALRDLRDPHVLFPGDELFIPDREQRTEELPTGKTHRFAVATDELFLRLRLLDLDGQPITNAPCDVGLKSTGADTGNTDAKGILEKPLEPNIQKGEVVAHVPPKKKEVPEQKLKFDLRIGHLNPEKKLSGQQARLNNLGYFAGYTLNDLEQFLWAAEEFECDRINNGAAPVTRRPDIVGVALGNQDNGEEKGDPKQQTGVQNEQIRKKLKEFHGC